MSRSSFEGEHYTICDYQATPRPVQAPHPPIVIGGGGRRMLDSRAGRPTSWGSTRTFAPARSPTDW